MGQAETLKTGFWRTLRFRFALWTAALLLGAMAVFGTAVYFNMARGLAASIDDSLSLNAAQAIAALEVENGRLELPEGFTEGPEHAELTAHGFTYHLLDADGKVLGEFGSERALPPDPDSQEIALEQRAAFTTVSSLSGGDDVRVHTVPIVHDNELIGIVQVAQSLGGVQDTLDRLLAALLVGVPLLALVAGIGGYWLAARALAPIDRITRTARRISAEDLTLLG